MVRMENFYYSSSGCSSGWWTHHHVQQATNSNNVPSPFSVQTPPLLPPHISDSSCSVQFCEFSHSWPSEEDKASTASKSHSQAEKRRRDRINAQLASLRKLIPKSDKMDKAALLGSVIEHVKDLKRKVMDMATSITVPTEVDEVSIDQDDQSSSPSSSSSSSSPPPTPSSIIKNNKIMIRASVCCEDRPELFSELIKVLKGLRLTAVKADIASVGGRIKSILVLCSKDSEDSVCAATLKQSLKSAVTKIAASSSSMASTCPARSKRQRFFLPSPCLH